MLRPGGLVALEFYARAAPLRYDTTLRWLTAEVWTSGCRRGAAESPPATAPFEKVRCPTCRGALAGEPERLVCAPCARVYVRENPLPNLRLREARARQA